jgi:hypothetical protein
VGAAPGRQGHPGGRGATLGKIEDLPRGPFRLAQIDLLAEDTREPVTDADLEHLRELPSLDRALRLHRQPITDAGVRRRRG